MKNLRLFANGMGISFLVMVFTLALLNVAFNQLTSFQQAATVYLAPVIGLLFVFMERYNKNNE